MGVGGAGVEAAQFVVAGEDVADEREDGGVGDDALEDLAFVDEIGEASRAGFLAELAAGGVAFEGEETGQLAAHLGEESGRHVAGKDDVAQLIQLLRLLGGHNCHCSRLLG